MNATHYRVTVKATVTGGSRIYTYTDATDAAHAERKAMAEATIDYGFMNAGLTVESVRVWNFETKTWDAVAAPAEVVKDVADMTDEEKGDEITRMWVESNGGMLPYYGFFGGGPASDKAKGYVRSLLRRHAGRREAELIRWMLNDTREAGGTISKCDVLPAIKILKAL